jgi:hypothetical protein
MGVTPQVAGFSHWRSGFTPSTAHVESVVDKVAMRQVFLRVLQFSPACIIPPLFHIQSHYHLEAQR